MDVYETETEQVQQQGDATNDIRLPLTRSEQHNAAVLTIRKPRIREVTSRYKSPLTPTRLSANATSIPKRSQSVERRRPTTPPSSPSRPSTPVSESPLRSFGGRTIEGLWPSTRSLSVSFQADTFSIPASKRERPVTPVSSVHELRNSANVTQRQTETLAAQQHKVTSERKRTPLRRKNNIDLSENSKPVENRHAKVFDQHRWPSRTGGKVSANFSTTSVDLTDKGTKSAALPTQRRGVSPTQKVLVSDSRRLYKSPGEVAKRANTCGSRRLEYDARSTCSAPSSRRREYDDARSTCSDEDDASWRMSGAPEFSCLSPGASLSSLEAQPFITRPSRTQSLPIPMLHLPPSPKLSPKGLTSPSHTRPSSPFSSASSVTSRSSSSSSFLTFIADVPKGKKCGTRTGDAHQLRLLYNRYLQWRFVNARADVALSIQKMTAENIIHDAWNTTTELRDLITMKRIDLQQMRKEMKLNLILNEQMTYLDDWAIVEGEHSGSLLGVIEALESNTLRIPVTGGARADIRAVKEAISSAVDIMQAMGSSICSLLPRVEGTNHLVSQLASVAAQERAMLDTCGDLLASTEALQVEECSLRTHLMQMEQALLKGEPPFSSVMRALG